MRYHDDIDDMEPREGSLSEADEDFGTAPWDAEPRSLSRRELRKKRRLEEKLRRLENKEGAGVGQARRDEDDLPEKEPHRKSKLTLVLAALMTGNILSKKEVTKTYPYLIFIAFLAFLYIGNIFSMQRLYRQQTVLTREVRELRTKSMTIASECMQATRQSNIVREIERRGIPLRESLEPNRVIQDK